MESKQKAKELVEKYKEFTEDNHAERYCNAKQCAIICVDEILNSNPSYDDYGGDGWKIIDNTEYWQEVKNEIQKL